MLESLVDTEIPPEIRIRFIVDYGESHERDTLLTLGNRLKLNVSAVGNRHKSSLTKLWNQAIIECETDWVFHSGDDSVFVPGWYDKCIGCINENKYDIIHLLHYGGFAMHKRLVLTCGWFDERFLGGGYEDVDYQIRLSECGVSPGRVWMDPSSTHMRHGRHEMNTHEEGHWTGNGNDLWWMRKWSKSHCYDLGSQNIRTVDEIDWYPYHTMAIRRSIHN